MRWIKAKLVGVMFLLPAVAALAATTVYVSPAGNNTSPFDTWTKAATGIQPAVNVATNSDVVLVTNGPYLLTTQIVVTNGVTLRSVNGAALTTLDGQYPTLSNRCVYLSYTGAVLDGFTVTRGCTNSGVAGGGIWIGKGRAQNCTVISNYSDANGGGIYLQTGTVWNCVVATNRGGSGGGIYIVNSDASDTGAVVSNCVIRDNYGAGDWGAGIYLTVHGTIDSCIISNNVLSSVHCGGGVLLGDGGVLRNSLVVNNSANSGSGGGVGVWRRAVMENCTVVNNSGGTGSGLRAGIFASPTPINTFVRNCVIYNNTGNTSSNYYFGSGTLVFTNCCTSPLPTDPDSANNIAVDPAFVGGGNYRLANNSPCINTGINQEWMTGAADLAGRMRIRYGRVDMGAYEFIRSGAIYGFH